jgi:peptidoglycan/xylan/chitin deacetylase (PgdA/CDA1 family)
MPDICLFQRFMTTLSGGFVLALHQMPPERLTGFVECLRPAQPVPLSELVERSKRGCSTSGLFAITVDDGEGDNVRALAQLFRARAWPATFYLPTRYLDTSEGMVFQLWRGMKPLLPRRKLGLKSRVIDLSYPDAVEDLSQQMELLWHTRRPEAYLPLTLELAQIAVQESGRIIPAIPTPPPITWPEVAELSKDDLIQFESHGISHTAVSALTVEELEFEMKHSRDVVAEHTGRPCRHLAYPFGSPQSIGSGAAAVARRFYDSAVTMSLGHVDSADPWLLPRIPLYPTNSNLLVRLKILLKCSEIGRARFNRTA